MSIWDEANKLKQQRQQDVAAEHQCLLKEARSIIPDIANFVKEEVIRDASSSDVESRIVCTGFFKTKRYLPFCVETSPTQEHWYRILSQCPEIFAELRAAIEAKGLSDVIIGTASCDGWYNYIFFKGKLMK